jgi:hypothetical protein
MIFMNARPGHVGASTGSADPRAPKRYDITWNRVLYLVWYHNMISHMASCDIICNLVMSYMTSPLTRRPLQLLRPTIRQIHFQASQVTQISRSISHIISYMISLLYIYIYDIMIWYYRTHMWYQTSWPLLGIGPVGRSQPVGSSQPQLVKKRCLRIWPVGRGRPQLVTRRNW